MEQCKDLANTVAAQGDCDVLLFNGPLQRDLDDRVMIQCRKRRRRKNILVILVTEGGNADCAFRLGRCLQQRYDEVKFFIAGYCKSAGTLLCIAGHELIMSDHGELGPLDVQMPKADDWTLSSGLTVTSSLRSMQAQAQEMFRSTVLELRRKMGGLYSARTAAQIATKLTVGVLQPIFQQIEAMHIGEAGRALSIARFYGERLAEASENLAPGALENLLVGYPSHGYVIDRAEAEELFISVREPNEAEMALAEVLENLATQPISDFNDSQYCYLSDEVQDVPTPHNQGEGAGENDGRPAPGNTAEAARGDAAVAAETDGIIAGHDTTKAPVSHN